MPSDRTLSSFFKVEMMILYLAAILKDEAVLENTDFDVPLKLKQEQQMITDKLGILKRKKLSRLLESIKIGANGDVR